MNNNGEMRQSRPCLWAFTLMALAAVLLLANREALAQTPTPTPWVQNGNNINNTNTGNVGVGTANPNQKLGVLGMIGLYPQPWVSPNVRGMFMFHSGAGGSIYAFNNPGGTADPIGFSARSFDFSTYIGGTPYTRLSLDNAGNVGIGTTVPTVRLHVAGSTRVDGTSGRLYFGSLAVENYRGLEFVGETPTIFSIRHHDPNVAWQHIALNPHGGNVGVGTGATDPAYKFDVAGHIRSSSGGFVFPDGSVQTTAATGGASSTIAAGNVSAGQFGASTGGGNFSFMGNLGVGTATPNQKLGVQGMFGLYAQPWVMPSARGMFMFHDGTGGSIYAYNYPGGTADPIGFSARDLNFSTYIGGTPYARFTITNSGNIGIGTSTPAYKLDVLDSGNNTYSARFIQSNSTASNGLFIQTQTASAGDTALHILTNAGATVGLSVRNTGNVGIGTPTPAYKLDVAGSVRSSSGGFVFPDGTVQTTAVTGGASSTVAAANVSAGQLGANIGGGDFGFPGHITQENGKVLFAKNASGAAEGWMWPRWTDNMMYTNFGSAGWNIRNSSSANVMLLTNDGNVGIGTTTPATKLDVTGSLHVSGVCSGGVPNIQGGYMSWNQKNCGTGEVDFINHQGGGGGGFWFANTANGSTLSSLMFISGDGKVGIGKDDPQVKLDVKGSVNVDGGNLNVTGTITGGSIEAKYQDLAEWVPARGALPAGTVVVLDSEQSNRVMASSTSYDTGVAGVVSAEPGIILGEAGEGKVKVATTGRVKVKVDATRAAIRIGDLLVTSNVEGMAMKSEPFVIGGRRLHAPGTIVGKALEPLASGVGEILVLLSMQ